MNLGRWIWIIHALIKHAKAACRIISSGSSYQTWSAKKRAKNSFKINKKKNKTCCLWRELKLIRAKQIFWICAQAEMQLFQPWEIISAVNTVGGQVLALLAFSWAYQTSQRVLGMWTKATSAHTLRRCNKFGTKQTNKQTVPRQSSANWITLFSCFVFDSSVSHLRWTQPCQS